jgi:exonuclease-1
MSFSFAVNYSLHAVKMMKHYGVTPIVILDGCPLPGKEATNAERREKRRQAMKAGKEVK